MDRGVGDRSPREPGWGSRQVRVPWQSKPEGSRERAPAGRQPPQSQNPRERARAERQPSQPQNPRERARPGRSDPKSEDLRARPGERSDRKGRDRGDLISVDPRLARLADLNADALDRLRPGRPVTEVTDTDIVAAQDALSKALPITIDLLSEQAGRSRPSQAGIPDPALLAAFRRILDRGIPSGRSLQEPEFRDRLVNELRSID
jgi:hypothetical protein